MANILKRFTPLSPETPEDIVPYLKVEPYNVHNPNADSHEHAIDNTFRIRKRMTGRARRIGVFGLAGVAESVLGEDRIESNIHFKDYDLEDIENIHIVTKIENPDDFPDTDFVRIVAQGVHQYLHGLDSDKEPSEAVS